MSISFSFGRPSLTCMRAIACVFLSVSLTPWILATDNGRASQEDDIREVIFRNLLTKTPYTMRGKVFEGYLALGFRKRTGSLDESDMLNGLPIDPSDVFMRRFRDLATVHKASSCRVAVKGGGVRDKQTDEPGLLLVVTDILWVSDTEAKVEAEYFRAPLAAEGFTYVVKRESDGWKITDSARVWIS
jgi:hypothetical protein